MNKTAIRNYAVWARTALIDAVVQKAYEYEIKDGAVMNGALDSINGRLLSADEKEWRRKLIEEINQKNFNQVMEEAAYTWFNRFIALRYMEVNGFIPSRVRVFTNEDGDFKPDILKEAMTVEIEGLDRSKVLDLIEKQNNEELYKYLIITQCNALSQGLPYMFEKISDWTELLFPANLLRADSIIGRMINDIPEEDWQDAVQIIGWMYQFYNIEPKAKVFAKAGGSKIAKEEIPAATQLFTPDWIVRYMVENSLGKLWVEGHPDNSLKSNWKYYLEEAEQEPEVETELQKIRTEYATINPEDIKVIDPCMGSGHILVYAFDVLMQIYTASGYSEREAAKSILENNLFGLDIDDRAGQLAYFAVMMKARKYNRRILNGEIRPNVFAIQDSSFMSSDLIAFVARNNQKMESDLIGIRNVFADAKEYGSILNVPEFDFEKIYARIDEIRNDYSLSVFEIGYRDLAVERLYQLVKQAEIMHQKYDITVTNPPYMAVSAAGAKLNSYVVKNFPDSKTDMFAVFIERCGQMLKKNGLQAMITMHSWMFLSSYEKLRSKLLSRDTINMAHLGARAFEEIGGEVVQTTAFVFRKSHNSSYKATFCRLVEPNTQNGKEEMFLSGVNRYQSPTSNFSKIPGSPIAYWVSECILSAFATGKSVGDYALVRNGMKTGDNGKFLRLWWEVQDSKTSTTVKNYNDAEMSSATWFPYNKGGEYRKWYGNNDYVVNWKHCGEWIFGRAKQEKRNVQDYPAELKFKPSLSWSLITSSKPAFRYKEHNLSDIAGMSLFTDRQNVLRYLGLLNSNVALDVLRLIAPTINFQAGDIARVPVITQVFDNFKIVDIVEENISVSEKDWDSFETSWDFKKHPLV